MFLLCFVLVLLGTVNGQLDFLVLGDWGGLPVNPYTTPIEVGTAQQMAKTAAQNNAQFVVALGDNFYFDGVKNEYDRRFYQTYAHVFNHSSLQVPWHVVAGNHDHHGNVSAQIAYSKHNPHWRFPNYWFAQKFQVPGTNATLKLVMIDTILLCGNSGDDADLTQPQGAEDSVLAEQQWAWLEGQLKSSRDTYLLVGGHFPVYSVAEHGPTHCLVDRLRPILEKYRVSAYLCGHDHNLQHLSSHGVHYFVVGAANFVKDNTSHRHSVPHHALQFYWADITSRGGFAHVTVSPSSLQFNIIDASGKLLHEQAIYPRRH